MFKPDLLLQYCVYCDYPIYRAWIAKYRNKFNKIIIYPSRHHGVIDLEEFAKKVLPETWVDPVKIDYGVEDWRQAETIPMLKHVESDWLWFSEQDFFCKDWDKLFSDLEKASRDADMMGLWNPTHFPYVHPSCLIIKKELLDQTKKDFRAHPEINGADHFSFITKNAQELFANIVTLQDMGWTEDKAMHLGGLTYIYQNFKDDFTNHIGVKYPSMFQMYNALQRLAPVEQNQEFINLTYKVEEQLRLMKLDSPPVGTEDFFTIW